MMALFKAELHRLMTRWPRWIILGLIFAAMLVSQLLQADANGPGFKAILEFTAGPVFQLTPAILCLTEAYFVFEDDKKSGIFKSAIGLGISRRDIVIQKVLTAGLLMLVDFAALAVLMLLVNLFVPMFAFEPLNLYITSVRLGCAWLQMMFFLCVAALAVYTLKNTSGGLIITFILMAGAISELLKMLFRMDFLKGLNLMRWMPTTMFRQLEASLNLGVFHPGIVLILAAVAAVIVWGAVAVFKKQELEF
ncbi:MAG: hypothetical protein HUJ54_09255 [Erysipelotrichaceae bacterium]|nr:hypothetical protein [Erysipelotrichaceae bacterium]